MEKAELIEALREVLISQRSIDDKTHRKHHDFIEILIRREHRKAERWDKVKTQVYGWGLVGLLSAIGTAVYNTFFTHGGHS